MPGRVAAPTLVVSVVDQVQATVLSVDPEKRRIGLSLDTKKLKDDSTKPEEVNLADYSKPKQSLGTLGDLLKESMKKQK